MASDTEPQRPRPPRDDDAPGLPAIDGAEPDTALDTGVELDVGDEEASALDDRGASDLEGTLDDDFDLGPTAVAADEDAPAPLDPDPSLAAGESERWTEGSDASEDAPWQEAPVAEPSESSLDRGEEGLDEALAAGDALPGLPPARAGDADDDADDALDLSEASSLETPGAEPDAVEQLPHAGIAARWHGPSREAARAIAVVDGQVLVGARGLWRLDDAGAAVSLPLDVEVSALLAPAAGRGAWIGTESGQVWWYPSASAPTHAGRPGTDDASLGGVDLALVAGVVVARTRGGALFRKADGGWVGPIVPKNVRRIRAGLGSEADWLALVVGSAAAPALLATRDARTFERLREPAGEIALEASRSGDVVAVATARGHLFVSRDAGASYARVPGVVDVERVWAHRDGTVVAATFHEATDHGRLVRVVGARADVLLDVEAEVSARRLTGPGEHDGDGRIHALAPAAGVLWVATGVGAFSLPIDLGSLA